MSTHDEGWEARANRFERKVGDLQTKLRQALEERDRLREMVRQQPFTKKVRGSSLRWPSARQLARKFLAERDAAIGRGERAMHECSSYFNAWTFWKLRASSFEVQLRQVNEERKQALRRADAAIEDAAKQRALAGKYRGALEQFSLWLEQECKRGTLDLGFGPDWSAKKVQSALDRLLAVAPAEAQEEGN